MYPSVDKSKLSVKQQHGILCSKCVHVILFSCQCVSQVDHRSSLYLNLSQNLGEVRINSVSS